MKTWKRIEAYRLCIQMMETVASIGDNMVSFSFLFFSSKKNEEKKKERSYLMGCLLMLNIWSSSSQYGHYDHMWYLELMELVVIFPLNECGPLKMKCFYPGMENDMLLSFSSSSIPTD